MKRLREAIGAALLAAAALWIYAPAIHGGWIWDDDAEIVHYAALREPGGLARIWSGRAGVDYLPLKSTAQWLEWRLWGGDTRGYHAVNLALHLLSALLLWRLLRRLGLGRLGSWLGAFIFALHPMAVESVAWISEFKNALSLPFLLLAMLAWIEFDDRSSHAVHETLTRSAPFDPHKRFITFDRSRSGTRKRFVSHVLALFCFLAALLCKASVVMLPLILLLHVWWKRGRIGRRDVGAALPFFLLALAFGGITVAFQRARAIAGVDLHLGGLGARLGGAGAAAAFYFCRAVFPIAWAPIFPRWAVDPPGAALFLPWLALAAGLAWLAARAGSSPAARTALAGLGFFFLNLLPVLGIIPMAYGRISLVADHLAYIPLAGIALLAGAAAETLTHSAPFDPHKRFITFDRSRIGTRTRFVSAALAAIAIPLACASRHEASYYRDEAAFWTHALERNPRSWTAENNVAKLWYARGRMAEAEAHFRAALRLNPEDAEAHFNLALILTASRRWEESLAEDAAALRVRPDFPEARRGLGNTLLQWGRPGEAVPELEAALRLKPDYAEAHADLGVAWASLGRPAAGIEELETALRLQPGSAETHNNLGVTLLRVGRTAAAADEFRAALRIDPAHAGARANLEAAERDLGN